MDRKVLVPLDGSPFSERILAHLIPLLSPHHSRLVLLRVLSPVRLDGYSATWTGEGSAAREEAEAKTYLMGLQGDLMAQGFQVQTRISGGDVAAAIVEVAEQEQASLIAMTTHGRSGVSRWALGSVADHVVRISSLPVLLVRADMESSRSGTLRRLLVPLDGSSLAEQALAPAKQLAQAKGASLLLMRAVEMNTEREIDGLMLAADGPSMLRAQRARAADHYLGHMQARVQADGLASEVAVLHAAPAAAILHCATEQGVDLIVMGTHARSGLGRWVHGSVADSVLREAPCPLLLVRGTVAVETAAARVAHRCQTPCTASAECGFKLSRQ